MRSVVFATLLLLASCAHDAARFVPKADAVEVEDLTSELIRALEASADDQQAGAAWLAYLRLHPELDSPAELTSVRPEALGKAARQSLPQLRAVAQPYAEEAREVARSVGALFGRSLPAKVVLAVQRSEAPLVSFEGPRVVLNARSAAVADPTQRRALLAHALALGWLEPPPSLGPLASALYLRTKAAAVALSVAPSAPRSTIAVRSAEDWRKLDARLALTAREALAALDSAAEAQAIRFFGAPAAPDPLVPPGAGPHLAVQLAAELIQGLGSAERVLRLAPGDLKREAARALQRMASPP